MNEEFSPLDAHKQFQALDPRAVDRIDMLTAVMHELGHVLGFEHHGEGVMRETLPLGTRRVWDEIDSVLDDDFDTWPNEVGFRAETVDAVYAEVSYGASRG